ncbi:dimethylamine monooxygenase subunit DmmA family protein [Marinobacterium stanieri]|uniref:dimethylamine monooxygenase subunit DmmA family protein n=1 Tax=Marinobacterium stanieri TaxID=49186 RepID=UPI00025580D7|nr:dimethylamine monooxygenase subunit DmmA family protein [Marinobacterium stanieri]
MQIDPSIKSRPKYVAPELVASAGLQLFVSESDAGHLLEPLYRQCSESGAQWLVAEPGNAPGTLADSLSGYLQRVLSDAPVTTRLYVAGSEGFLWDIRNQALSAGLVDEQIQLAPPISKARRLFCTHCYTLMEGVTSSPHTCSGCGRLLLVRDHFARLHGAYVGVQINAEDPEEQLEQEVLQ